MIDFVFSKDVPLERVEAYLQALSNIQGLKWKVVIGLIGLARQKFQDSQFRNVSFARREDEALELSLDPKPSEVLLRPKGYNESVDVVFAHGITRCKLIKVLQALQNVECCTSISFHPNMRPSTIKAAMACLLGRLKYKLHPQASVDHAKIIGKHMLRGSEIELSSKLPANVQQACVSHFSKAVVLRVSPNMESQGLCALMRLLPEACSFLPYSSTPVAVLSDAVSQLRQQRLLVLRVTQESNELSQVVAKLNPGVAFAAVISGEADESYKKIVKELPKCITFVPSDTLSEDLLRYTIVALKPPCLIVVNNKLPARYFFNALRYLKPGCILQLDGCFPENQLVEIVRSLPRGAILFPFGSLLEKDFIQPIKAMPAACILSPREIPLDRLAGTIAVLQPFCEVAINFQTERERLLTIATALPMGCVLLIDENVFVHALADVLDKLRVGCIVKITTLLPLETLVIVAQALKPHRVLCIAVNLAEDVLLTMVNELQPDCFLGIQQLPDAIFLQVAKRAIEKDVQLCTESQDKYARLTMGDNAEWGSAGNPYVLMPGPGSCSDSDLPLPKRQKLIKN